MLALASQQEVQAVANVEAEAALLGALLIENSLIKTCLSLVETDDFFDPLHARIFAELQRCDAEKRPANPLLLRPIFGDEAHYLAQLTSDGQGLLAPREMAEQVKELADRRRHIAALEQALIAYRDMSDDAPLPDVQELFKARGGATFETLDLPALENMPAPRWLVHETIAAEGMTIIYGDPGAGKSFVALDMALRVAMGMDWHGIRAKRTGVLYIAGEGARGLGKRVTGWRLQHGFDSLDAPFALLPMAVQITDDADRAKLLRTIETIDFDIGLVVVDTVSRAIAGVDENSQETMSAFIRACDLIKAQTGGALIGVHHSGKDKERGMRGSSVLLGGVDASIKLTKEEGVVTLGIEKQKDGEDGGEVYLNLERVDWLDENGDEISTLVPVKTDARAVENGAPTHTQIVAAFAMMADAWAAKKPLSSKVQTRRDGRYAPQVFCAKIGGEAKEWDRLLCEWLARGIVTFEQVDNHTKTSGLRVIDAIT